MVATYGQVVLSKAGRDKGKFFVIVGFYDEQHVLVSDGDLRPIEKPKKKKLKHIELTENIIFELKSKIEADERIQNAEIRKKLRDIQ